MIARMIDREKAINDIANTIRGEKKRMCVTSDIAELDTMALHAIKNIERLQHLICEDLVDIAEIAESIAERNEREIAESEE